MRDNDNFVTMSRTKRSAHMQLSAADNWLVSKLAALASLLAELIFAKMCFLASHDTLSSEGCEKDTTLSSVIFLNEKFALFLTEDVSRK